MEFSEHRLVALPVDAELPSFDADFDERLTELAEKAVQKSGNLFFQVLLKMNRALLGAIDHERFKNMPDAAVVSMVMKLNPETVLLIARHYAGDIKKPKRGHKRKAGVQCNADKVADIFDIPELRHLVMCIFMERFMRAAHSECQRRLENAEASDHWARELNECDGYADAAEMWEARAEAIDNALEFGSWEQVADALKVRDWYTAVNELDGLCDIDYDNDLAGID